MKYWSKYLATAIVIGILIMAIVGSIIFANPHEEGPWIDTTDVVSEQTANAIGTQAVEPLINTDQGNMLVFFFTIAGVFGGFVIGYYWRKLMIDKDKVERDRLDKKFFVGVGLAVILLAVSGYEAFSLNPCINPDLGDVKLFAFISLGTIMGFISGFNWKSQNTAKNKISNN
jgi:cobalt/nickel transport protein